MSKDTINILYHSRLPHAKMGGQKSLLALIDNLDRSKFKPFLAMRLDGKLREIAESRGITVIIKPVPAMQVLNISKLIKTRNEYVDFIKDNNIKIIHTDDDKFAYFSTFIARKSGAKSIYHARVTKKHKYDRLLEPRIDQIIGISKATKFRFKESTINSKFVKIYNGVDCEIFSPVENRRTQKESLGLDTDKFTVLFVGQMKVGKGIFDLVKAAEILKEENISFIFVGDFLDEATKREWFEYKELNGINNIEWLGQKAEIYKWMQASDLLVLPSHEGVEGMGRVIFEAMACGTPVIASDTSGVREAITPETGILFPEKSAKDIAKAKLELMNNRTKREQFIKAGRKRAMEVFDIKIHARKVMDLYEKMVKN